MRRGGRTTLAGWIATALVLGACGSGSPSREPSAGGAARTSAGALVASTTTMVAGQATGREATRSGVDDSAGDPGPAAPATNGPTDARDRIGDRRLPAEGSFLYRVTAEGREPREYELVVAVRGNDVAVRQGTNDEGSVSHLRDRDGEIVLIDEQVTGKEAQSYCKYQPPLVRYGHLKSGASWSADSSCMMEGVGTEKSVSEKVKVEGEEVIVALDGSRHEVVVILRKKRLLVRDRERVYQDVEMQEKEWYSKALAMTVRLDAESTFHLTDPRTGARTETGRASSRRDLAGVGAR